MIVRAALQNTGNYVLVTRGCSLPRLSSLNGMYGVGLVAARQSCLCLGHK